MTGYGVTPRGLILKRYPVLLEENRQKARELFGSDVDLALTAPIGAFVALLAWDHARREERSEEIFYSAYLSTAEGVNLDRVARIGGGARDGEQSASVQLHFRGAAESVVPVQTECETSQGIVFATVQSLTLDKAGAGTVFAKCLRAGPVGLVPASSITRIKTPVAGVGGVSNPEESVGGRLIESDAEFRARYQNTPLSTGSSIDAIEEALRRLEGVVKVSGFANRTNATDRNGLPGKSIEMVIFGGVDLDIAGTILAHAPADAETVGTTRVVVRDAQDRPHEIRFSRPTTISVRIEYTITPDQSWSSAQIETIKRNAIKYVGGIEGGLEYPGVGIGQ